MRSAKLEHLRFLLPLIAAGFFYSCSTLHRHDESAKSVEVSDKIPSTSRCTFIAIVTGNETTSWADANEIVESAIEDGREQAAKKGATHVVMQGSPQIIYNAEAKRREATVTLNAYKCKK